MKKYSRLQKIISVLMSFILMTEFTGCYSTKVISTSEIKVSDKYFIHSKNSTYPVLDNALISNDTLSGKLYLGKNNFSKENVAHIYVLSDSLIKINNDVISIPTNRITKIEHKVYDLVKTKTLTTIVIIAWCTAGAVLIGVGVAVIFNSLIVDSPGSTTFCSNW